MNIISYQKFKLNSGLRSRSVQKRMNDDDNDESLSPSLKLVKKRSSQCRESSSGDQSTMGFSDAFQDSPKAKQSIGRFSSYPTQQNSRISQSEILNHSKLLREQQEGEQEEDHQSPPSKTQTVPIQAIQLEQFNKNYQILKLFSSDSPSKKNRKMLSPLYNFGSPQQKYQKQQQQQQQQQLDLNENVHSSLNQNYFYLTNVPSSFEEHYKQSVNKSIPMQRIIRAQSLSTSPKKLMESSIITTVSRIRAQISPQKSLQQRKEEELERKKAQEEQEIMKFDNLVKHRLQKQMVELDHNETEAFYNNFLGKDTFGQKTKSKTSIPYSLYLMKKDRDLLISRIKEIHKQPNDKTPIVKDNIIKEVRIQNFQNHKILDKMIHQEGEKYKEELLSKSPYKSTIYDVFALNQKSQSRVKSRLLEELPMISRFNTFV